MILFFWELLQKKQRLSNNTIPLRVNYTHALHLVTITLSLFHTVGRPIVNATKNHKELLTNSHSLNLLLNPTKFEKV